MSHHGLLYFRIVCIHPGKCYKYLLAWLFLCFVCPDDLSQDLLFDIKQYLYVLYHVGQRRQLKIHKVKRITPLYCAPVPPSFGVSKEYLVNFSMQKNTSITVANTCKARFFYNVLLLGGGLVNGHITNFAGYPGTTQNFKGIIPQSRLKIYSI